jgi:hypothetical protein
MVMKGRIKRAVPLLSLFLFFSCGIEDYLYINPVPMGFVFVDSVSRAIIQLPVISEYYFTHFTIYYRIYVSNVSLTSISEAQLNDINPLLYSDYYAFKPYTDNTDQVPTSIGPLFANRNFHILEVEGANIEDVLSGAAGGGVATLEFVQSPGSIPFLMVNNTFAYSLYRSSGYGRFNPLPDRHFVNSSGLNSSANAVPTINADVANKSIPAGSPRYTYAAFYITGTGIDGNYSPIYSTPTFIAVLRLPEP